MITTIFFKLIGFILLLVDWITPNWKLPINLISAFAGFFDNVVSFDVYFPTITLLQCITIVLTFNLLVIIGKAMLFLVGLIRGSGGGEV